eukprot:TRINITY_DN1135_c5_g1_i1.p1 TRINITY_DN1135_c5_g1~~TRINITY_DN1135_c5_g1_i1.p1  ORF type:complete len:747 (+),score=340.02 TRINITY_DN1135_c5_g1_i1:43-2283(+)
MQQACDGSELPTQIKSVLSTQDPQEVFDLLEKLGKGAHGIVYKATNRLTGEIVAIKQLSIAPANLSELVAEITTLKELGNSPYCISYYGSFYKDNRLWIAMEFFDAGSIGDLLNEKKNLTEPQIGAILCQVLPAIDFLHRAKKIHRDVKAGNLLLNKKGQVKLADFGITTTIDENQAKRQTQVGSPYWMAPEIIDSSGYDQKVDIWALGIAVLEMAEYENPFFEANPMTAMFQIVTGDPPKLQQSTWSPELISFIETCLNKDPQARPTSVDLLEHVFVKKYSDINKNIEELAKLAIDYQNLLQQLGCNAAIRGEQIVEVADEEGIIRVILPDLTYRSLLVKSNETVANILTRFKSKLDLDSIEFFSLYKLIKQGNIFQEKSLPDSSIPLQIIKENAKLPISFAIREKTDRDSFCKLTDLTATFGLLAKKNVNFNEELQTNKQLKNSLLELLLAPNLSVVTALCEVADAATRENLAFALITIFESRAQTSRLICKISKKEIALVNEANSLFRGTSMAGKLLSRFGFIAMSKFLKQSLQSIIVEHILPLSQALEINPRCSGSVNVQEHTQKLQNICKLIIDSIISKSDNIPPAFKKICREVQIIVTRYFPHKEHLISILFLFTTLICPALVSPHAYYILDAPEHVIARRSLILISKVIQSVATGVPFGVKEGHLAQINSFVEQIRPSVINLLSNITEPLDSNIIIEPIIDFTEDSINEALIVIAKVLKQKVTQIGQSMNVLPPHPTNN